MAAAGFVPKYPIVLIPGFLSSVLRVEHSETSSDWIGERVWLSLGKIGGEKLRHVFSRPYNFVANAFSDEDVRFRNEWMEHVTLQTDCRSDPDGIRVRAMAGNDGVTFLAPGPFTNALSYVMGPLIRTLRDLGYTDENLVAAPYDWRLPLPVLEERDGYFTKVKQLIEDLSKKHGTPVAVLAHSMGNRTFHYFLNWVKKQPDGQKWIDAHVYSFIAVGAPWLGAPKTVRGFITGERFGLEPFMTEKQSITWARCMGSLMCLIPQKPELYFGDQMRMVYLKRPDGAWVGRTYSESFEEAGCGHLLDLYSRYYLTDDCYGGPDGEAILQPPPVRRLYAIYGVNMDTELFYLYKKSSNGTLHLGSAPSAAFGGDYKIEAGIGHETERSRQPIIKILTGEDVRRSGDGSVPYASLHYCAFWKDSIEYLKIDELERVDHRHILSNRLFFQRILEYVSERKVAEPPPAPIVQVNVRHIELEERNGHRYTNTWLRAVKRDSGSLSVPRGSSSTASSSKDELSDDDTSASRSDDLSEFSTRSATPMEATYSSAGASSSIDSLAATPSEVSTTLAALLASLALQEAQAGFGGDAAPVLSQHRAATSDPPTPVSVTPRTRSAFGLNGPALSSTPPRGGTPTPTLMVSSGSTTVVIEPDPFASDRDPELSLAGWGRSAAAPDDEPGDPPRGASSAGPRRRVASFNDLPGLAGRSLSNGGGGVAREDRFLPDGNPAGGGRRLLSSSSAGGSFSSLSSSSPRSLRHGSLTPRHKSTISHHRSPAAASALSVTGRAAASLSAAAVDSVSTMSSVSYSSSAPDELTRRRAASWLRTTLVATGDDDDGPAAAAVAVVGDVGSVSTRERFALTASGEFALSERSAVADFDSVSADVVDLPPSSSCADSTADSATADSATAAIDCPPAVAVADVDCPAADDADDDGVCRPPPADVAHVGRAPVSEHFDRAGLDDDGSLASSNIVVDGAL